MDIVSDYLLKLRKVRGKSELHNLSQLQKVIKIHTDFADRAVGERMVEPFRRLTYQLREAMKDTLSRVNGREEQTYGLPETLANALQLKGFPHSLYPVREDKIVAAIDVCNEEFRFALKRGKSSNSLEKILSNLDEKATSFDKLKRQLYKSIKLSVVKDEALGKMYLPRGYVIIPNESDHPGFHVFAIKVGVGTCGYDHVALEPLDRSPARSFEQAMEEYVDRKLIGTVVVVKNADKCALYGTVVPITIAKYEKALGLTSCK